MNRMVRGAFDRERRPTAVDEEVMTKQSMAAECDINNILQRYEKTGVLSHIRSGGTYETLPDALDFHEAMNLVLNAQQMFEELPSKLRARFGNDPAQLLQFCEDPANKDEAIQLGLVPLPETKDPPAPADKKPESQPEKTPIEKAIDKNAD